jgi:hypothetical protein
MFDFSGQRRFPLTQASEEYPLYCRRWADENGKRSLRKIAIPTWYRWSDPRKGCRGVVLPTLQCGGTRCTSREAIEYFFEELTRRRDAAAGVGRDPSAPLAPHTPSARRKAIEQAERELESIGI